MALKEKAKKKREQRETPVPTLKSTVSSDMLDNAKDKLNNEANAQASINAGTPSLPNVAGMTPPVQSVSPQTTGLVAPAMTNPLEAEKAERVENLKQAPTFSDMLANSMSIMRQNAEKEKTDAAKMQQYYALADVFNAMGKLGGSAVGGAVGGNMADSAPAVDPYKESRGYLAAFEKAKAANERLKGLDDKAYALAATMEEREYNKRLRDADNEFKLKLTDLDHQWQKNFYDYKSKIDQAAAQGNLELKAKLEAEAKAAEQAYWKERAAISQGYQRELKNMSADIVRLQMGLGDGKDGKSGKPIKTKPFTFHNNTKTDIPETLYPEMLKYFASKGKIGSEMVDEENVETVLRNHPELVNGFLRMYGYGKPVLDEDDSEFVRNNYYFPMYSYMPEDLRQTAYQTGSAYSVENDPFASFLEN